MLLTKNFVFIHVPRTGGSFLIDVCLASAPSEWETKFPRPHGRYCMIPEELSHLPVLCFVRNPWDWYVSWYEYIMRLNLNRADPDAPYMWASAFESGRADFKTAVTRACTGVRFANRVTAPLMQALDLDHYSALLHWFVGEGIEAGRVEVARFENLRDDLLTFLRRHEIPISRTFQEALESAPPRNQSPRRGSYREYYDNGLREVVGRGAEQLIRRYGYTF